MLDAASVLVASALVCTAELVDVVVARRVLGITTVVAVEVGRLETRNDVLELVEVILDLGMQKKVIQCCQKNTKAKRGVRCSRGR